MGLSAPPRTLAPNHARLSEHGFSPELDQAVERRAPGTLILGTDPRCVGEATSLLLTQVAHLTAAARGTRWCAGAGQCPAPDPYTAPPGGAGGTGSHALGCVLSSHRCAQATGESSSRVLCWCSCTLAGRAAGTGMGQGVRRWMVLTSPRMLPMPVACVTARATVSLDVCGCVVVHAVIGIHMLYTVVFLCRSDACAEHLMRCAVQPEPLPSRWRVNAHQRAVSGRSPCTEVRAI